MRYVPKKLSLGPLETEILNLVWEFKTVTVKDVHDRILADPDRELAYTSVSTILKRLTEKGWLSCQKKGKVYIWQPLLSQEEAKAVISLQKLKDFLAVTPPEIAASFAQDIDPHTLEKLRKIIDIFTKQ